MSLALLFHYLLLNMFWRMHKDATPPQPNHTVTPTHIEPEQYNTWNKSTISCKLLKMDVLTFETCWAVNSEIVKQMTSSWSIFIQLCCWYSLQLLSETCFILRRVEWVIVITVLRSAYKVPVIIVRSYWNLNFIDRFFFFQKAWNIKFNENLFSARRVVPWGQTDRQTDRGMEEMKLIVFFFPQFCECG